MGDPMSHKTVYWFKAKRYGYGWGLPGSWQGWAFFVPWLILCMLTVRELAGSRLRVPIDDMRSAASRVVFQ
jgi:hypothetical protein